jgi:LPS-assembly protein
MLPHSLWAQDNNAGDCAVNGKSEIEGCSSLDSAANAPVSTTETNAKEVRVLDWAPVESLPAALQDRQCVNCGGRYMDPLAGVKTTEQPEDAPINADADSTEVRDNEVILTGGVEAVQGYRRLSADKAVIDREQATATLTGNVTLREPGLLLQGESAKIYSKTEEATVNAGQFVFHEDHMRGTADMLQRDTDGLIHVHNGSFTYWAPGENDWSIQARLVHSGQNNGTGPG